MAESLLDLYVRLAGTSECPTPYNRWCCMSAIAACVADRVWVERFRDERLAPNLYVYLVGHSGAYKSMAINTASRLLADVANEVGYFRGSLTGAALIQMLGAIPSATCSRPGRRFLVMDELGANLGDKIQADPFIKAATALYSGSDYAFGKGVVTRAWSTVSGHCLNWLAGTTQPWLQESVSATAIEGGFFARVACITGALDYSRRIYEPVYPKDYEDLKGKVKSYFSALTKLGGVFQYSPKARSLDRAWYEHRDPEGPQDESLAPWWLRRPALVTKLAMLLSLGESLSLQIEEHHILQAIEMSEEVASSMPMLIQSAGSGIDAKHLDLVKSLVTSKSPPRGQGFPHSKLLKRLTHHGIMANKLKLILDTLLESNVIRDVGSQQSGRIYVMVGRGRAKGLQAADSGRVKAAGDARC